MSSTITQITSTYKKIDIDGTEWISVHIFGITTDVTIRNDGGQPIRGIYTTDMDIVPDDTYLETNKHLILELGGLLYELNSNITESKYLWIQAVKGKATISVRVKDSIQPTNDILDIYNRIDAVETMSLSIQALKSLPNTRPNTIMPDDLFDVPKYRVSKQGLMVFIDGHYCVGGTSNTSDYVYTESGVDGLISNKIKFNVEVPTTSSIVVLSFLTGENSSGGEDNPTIDETFLRTVDKIHVRGLSALELKDYLNVYNQNY